MEPEDKKSFAEHAAGKQPGVFAELFDFMLHNKKWWITPVLLLLVLASVLLILGGTGVAPFIYTLF